VKAKTPLREKPLKKVFSPVKPSQGSNQKMNLSKEKEEPEKIAK